MSKKDRKKKKIDLSSDAEGFRHNPFANLLGDTERSELPQGPEPEARDSAEDKSSPDGDLKKVSKVVLRIQRKGRAGKTVTLAEGFDALTEEAIEDLASQLRKALGTGAGVEDGKIVIHGDQRDRARSWLEERGVKKIVS